MNKNMSKSSLEYFSASPIRIFIGFDQVESVAWHTLCHSILSLSSQPVTITPVKLSHIKNNLIRDKDFKQSNEFSFSRWMVPWLCGYKGYAIFMDCDMLLRTDISELWNMRTWQTSVQVCKHDYVPKDSIKYLGNTQYKYEKKNWSSVMIFNNEKCTRLTPSYVSSASGLELHQFKWLESDIEIGSLPMAWNHLVGEYDYDDDAKNVHFTVGGPYFKEYENCDYSQEWKACFENMVNCNQMEIKAKSKVII